MSTVRPLRRVRRRRAALAWRLQLDRFVLRVAVAAVASTCEHAVTRRRRHAVLHHVHANPGRAS